MPRERRYRVRVSCPDLERDWNLVAHAPSPEDALRKVARVVIRRDRRAGLWVWRNLLTERADAEGWNAAKHPAWEGAPARVRQRWAQTLPDDVLAHVRRWALIEEEPDAG